MGLFDTWSADYNGLGSDTEAKNRVVAALDTVRLDTQEVLKSLD